MLRHMRRGLNGESHKYKARNADSMVVCEEGCTPASSPDVYSCTPGAENVVADPLSREPGGPVEGGTGGLVLVMLRPGVHMQLARLV
jgi:hypothetical protein